MNPDALANRNPDAKFTEELKTRVSPEMKSELETLAKQEELSAAQLTRKAIKIFLKKHRPRAHLESAAAR